MTPHIPLPNPKSATSSKYTRNDRAALQQFRQKYIQIPDAKGRVSYITNTILPTLIVEWEKQQGRTYSDEEIVAETINLTKWIRNTWCLGTTKTKNRAVARPRASRTQVLWDLRRADVEKQMEETYGPPVRGAMLGRWLSTIAKMLAEMLPEDLAAIDMECDRRAAEGFPPDIQEKLRNRYYKARLDQTAYKNYTEMGILQFSIILSPLSSGQYNIEVHDPIANLMGANSMGSFKESEPKLFREFRAAFSGYHKHCLNSMRNVGANNPSDAANGNQTVFNNADVLDSSLTMEVGPGLFPRLKNGWSQHYNKMKKSIKESMLRIYLNAQYSCATQFKIRTFPLASISAEPDRFIDQQYLPSGWEWRNNLKNIRETEIDRFFSFIWDRQCGQELHNVFRMSHVKTSRIKGERVPSDYAPARPGSPTLDIPAHLIPAGPEGALIPIEQIVRVQRVKKIRRKAKGRLVGLNSLKVNETSAGTERNSQDDDPVPQRTTSCVVSVADVGHSSRHVAMTRAASHVVEVGPNMNNVFVPSQSGTPAQDIPTLPMSADPVGRITETDQIVDLQRVNDHGSSMQTILAALHTLNVNEDAAGTDRIRQDNDSFPERMAGGEESVAEADHCSSQIAPTRPATNVITLGPCDRDVIGGPINVLSAAAATTSAHLPDIGQSIRQSSNGEKETTKKMKKTYQLRSTAKLKKTDAQTILEAEKLRPTTQKRRKH